MGMAAKEKQACFPWEEVPIAAADRRRSERKAVALVGKLAAPSKEKNLQGRSVKIIDLSLHGVGLVSPEELKVGGKYGLQVSSDLLNLSSRIRIASCRKRADGEWDVGAEFA
jgi:c-di-GMP-binding flagellar brake protein YcgR